MYLCDIIIGDHRFGEEKHTAYLRYACVLSHQGHGPFSHLFENLFIPEVLHGAQHEKREEGTQHEKREEGTQHEKQEEGAQHEKWEVSVMVVVC